MTGLIPYPKLNVASPLALAVQTTGVSWLPPIVNIGAICGIASVILVNMLAQSRIFYSMSRDGLLPPIFSRLHPRYRTPHITTAITGIVVAIASGLFPISVLGQLVSGDFVGVRSSAPGALRKRTAAAATVQDTRHALGTDRRNLDAFI
jgi:APA family basic amino acid/polyamine antiporter